MRSLTSSLLGLGSLTLLLALSGAAQAQSKPAAPKPTAPKPADPKARCGCYTDCYCPCYYTPPCYSSCYTTPCYTTPYCDTCYYTPCYSDCYTTYCSCDCCCDWDDCRGKQAHTAHAVHPGNTGAYVKK